MKGLRRSLTKKANAINEEIMQYKNQIKFYSNEIVKLQTYLDELKLELVKISHKECSIKHGGHMWYNDYYDQYQPRSCVRCGFQDDL